MYINKNNQKSFSKKLNKLFPGFKMKKCIYEEEIPAFRKKSKAPSHFIDYFDLIENKICFSSKKNIYTKRYVKKNINKDSFIANARKETKDQNRKNNVADNYIKNIKNKNCKLNHKESNIKKYSKKENIMPNNL